MNRKQGFTLVELMVVLALLGILGALIAAGYSGYRDNMKDYTAQRMLDVLEEAYLYARTMTTDDNAVLAEVSGLVEKESLGGTYTIDPNGEEYLITYKNDDGKEYTRGDKQSTLPEPPDVPPPDDVTAITGNVRETMQRVLKDIKGMSNSEKREYFASHNYPVADNFSSFGNSFIREFLFNAVYNKSWPRIPNQFFINNNLPVPESGLYVQPYIRMDFPEEKVIVFAREKNVLENNWNTRFVYVGEQWFHYIGKNPWGSLVDYSLDVNGETYKSLIDSIENSGLWVALQGGKLQEGATP